MGTGYRKRFAPVMVISLVGVIVAGAGIALASPLAPSTHYDPMVAVARDITAQSYCQLSWEKEQGHKQVTIKVATCPAGTLIHTTKVPLSEALAKKEQYVLLPPRGSSSQVMAHIYQQIRDLRAADEMPFVHRSAADSPQTIHPLCNSTQSSVHLSWSPNYDKGSKFNSTMYYYGCGSQVMLVNGTIQGSQLDEANYWDHDQYGAGSWGRSDQYIGTYTLDGSLGNQYHTSCLYYNPYSTDNVGDYDHANVGPAC